jgi:hypothetical protein
LAEFFTAPAVVVDAADEDVTAVVGAAADEAACVVLDAIIEDGTAGVGCCE